MNFGGCIWYFGWNFSASAGRVKYEVCATYEGQFREEENVILPSTTSDKGVNEGVKQDSDDVSK